MASGLAVKWILVITIYTFRIIQNCLLRCIAVLRFQKASIGIKYTVVLSKNVYMAGLKLLTKLHLNPTIVWTFFLHRAECWSVEPG